MSKTDHESPGGQRTGRRADASRGSAPQIGRYRAADLIGDGPWVVIEHGNDEYRLRITRLGKLILTK